MCSIGAIHHPPIEVGVFLHSFKINWLFTFGDGGDIIIIDTKVDNF